MTENNENSSTNNVYYPKDVEVFKKVLVDITKNVADEINLFKSESGNAVPSTTKKDIRKAVIENVEQGIDYLINTENLHQKFETLNKLASKADDVNAWRPTTGNIEITSLKGTYLENKKKLLSKTLADLRQKRKELQENILQGRKIVKIRTKQIEKCQETQISEIQINNNELLKDL